MALVLLRHGESVWNRDNRFTGWTDVPLTEDGVAEARRAGRLLRDAGFRPAAAFVSVLERAVSTLDLVLAELGGPPPEVERAWELNERHYGALQGRNKREMEERHGVERLWRWRRGYGDAPPPVSDDDPRNPRNDPRYADAPPASLPTGESLRDTADRVIPYWERRVLPAVRSGAPVLVVAHGNSLRALVMHLEGISPEEIPTFSIPTGAPLAYRLDPSGALIDRRRL